MVHDPPIRTLNLTDISCPVQIKLTIMRFSPAYSHTFALRLKYLLIILFSKTLHVKSTPLTSAPPKSREQ